MRDNLKWKLGLRLTQEIDVSKLGIRYMHLARNSIGNKGAIMLASSLKQDAYLRGVNLKQNKIGESGMKELLNACHCNNNLLLLDVTHNSSVYEKKHYDTLFRDELLNNFKYTIENYIDRVGVPDLKFSSASKPSNKQGVFSYKQSRINFEWIKPELLGIEIEVTGEESNKRISTIGREVKVSIKSQFIKFASIIA